MRHPGWLLMLLLVLPHPDCLAEASSEPHQYSQSADSSDFGVRLLLIADKSAFLEMWAKPQPPNVRILRTVQIGSPFSAIVLFWGGRPDSSGNCQLFAVTRILDEKGAALATGTEKPLCTGHPPPPAGLLSMGETIIDLVATGEPAKLTVAVKIVDRVSGEVVNVSAPLEVK